MLMTMTSLLASAQQGVYTFDLIEDQPIKLSLKDSISIYVDSTGLLTISDFIQSTKLPFGPRPDEVVVRNNDVVWTRFNIRNASDKKRNEIFNFCNQSDSVWLYEVDSGILTHSDYTTGDLSPKLKSVPLATNLLAVTLNPQQLKTFYVKIKYNNGTSGNHFDHIFIETRQPMMRRILEKFMIQSFYAGVMLLFCLVSFFMFISFKERVFIYFGLLSLFFALYFLKMHGLIDSFVTYQFQTSFMSMINVIIAGINITLFLFVTRYIQLRDHFPRFYVLYGIVTFVTALSAQILKWMSIASQFSSLIHNSLLLIWILLTIYPVVILSWRKDKAAQILLISIGFLFVGSMLLILNLLNVLPSNPITQYGIQIGTIIFSGFLFYGLFDKINSIQKERFRIKVEKEKSDNLLMNVLPREIAEELKEKGETKAKNIENVSILFTDFKGFTQISGQMTATELVEEIHQCFRAFDEIVGRYEVEKIKTIGDAYMAAGIPNSKTEMLVNTVMAGIEMAEFITKRKEERIAQNKMYFEMRLGIHTGPIVAGVVGVKKFQYDVWGDTVNIASRLESAGEVGKVNISEDTYKLLSKIESIDEVLSFESRGKIEAKGKGKIEMFFVNRTLTL